MADDKDKLHSLAYNSWLSVEEREKILAEVDDESIDHGTRFDYWEKVRATRLALWRSAQ